MDLGVLPACHHHEKDGGKYLTAALCITKDPDTLVSEIKQELNKTCTRLDSYGAIAGKNYTLICYVNYFELQKMKEIIERNKGTFSTVSTIDEILR